MNNYFGVLSLCDQDDDFYSVAYVLIICIFSILLLYFMLRCLFYTVFKHCNKFTTNRRIREFYLP